MMGETELPLVESQQPRVYPKAAARQTPADAPASQPRNPDALAESQRRQSALELRMASEIERLTTLNNDLSQTVARAEKAKAESDNGLRISTRENEENGLRSERVEHPAAVKKTEGSDEVTVASATDSPATVEPAVAQEEKIAEKKLETKAYQSGDWLKARDQAIAQLQEEIALAKADKSRAEEVGQLETLLRMQYALAGRRDDAAKPVKELHEQEQEFWRSEVLGLADLLGPDRLANESRRFAVALKSLEEAESHLAAAGTLVLRNMALCRKVQDFGVVDRFKTTDFTKNQEVLLYVEVRNFTARQADGHNYETELQGSFRILDRSGAARAERTLPLDKQSSANLRRDYYIAYRLYIPSELPPGAYTLELTIEDRKGSKSNNALLDFNVTQ
jgi:hypothetical protein